MKKRRYTYWKTTELARLKRKYSAATPEELMAEFPGRSLSSIQDQASRQGAARKANMANLFRVVMAQQALLAYRSGVRP